MFHFFGRTFPNGKSYIEIRGFKFEGNNTASYALKCYGSHHLRFIDNTIQNTGAGGIASKFCDYVVVIGNKIHRTGYNQGWSSGISANSHQWFDTYPGFHSIVVNNFISGNYDNSIHKTDGNGIILDLSNDSYDPNTANTPPALVANNVVYGNGGRCVDAYVVSNIWVVNNTCYKNTLDLPQSDIGELVANRSKNIYFINNIAQAWNNRWAYQKVEPSQNIVFYKNIFYGGDNNFTYVDPAQLINANPLFVNPPATEENKNGLYAETLPSDQIGNGLSIQSASPARDNGIDPTTIPGIPREIVDGLRLYVTKDVVGTPRPCGAAFDIGAYEYPGSCVVPPLAPTGLTVKRVQ
jgi:serralysin